MNRDQKAAVIEEIAADITASQAVFAVDYRGITVAQADALRTRLRECDASFRVVKNSLTERAAERAGADQLRPLLAGPTALTFVRGDAAAAAKAISDFARTTQLLAFKGGLMDGAALSSADVAQISRLPSRDVLYGQLVGLIADPIAGLARTLNALIGGLAVGLGAVLEQRGGEAAVAASTPVRRASAGAGGGGAAQAPVRTRPRRRRRRWRSRPRPRRVGRSPRLPSAGGRSPPAEAEGETPEAAPEAEAPEAEAGPEAAPEAEADAPEATTELEAAGSRLLKLTNQRRTSDGHQHGGLDCS